MHTELQQEKANLWTKKEFPTWNPCNQTELQLHHGYWAVRRLFLHLHLFCTVSGLRLQCDNPSCGPVSRVSRAHLHQCVWGSGRRWRHLLGPDVACSVSACAHLLPACLKTKKLDQRIVFWPSQRL